MTNLEKVLDVFVKIKTPDCECRKVRLPLERSRFLWYYCLRRHGIEPVEEEKVTAVKEESPPQTPSEIRRFLGSRPRLFKRWIALSTG